MELTQRELEVLRLVAEGCTNIITGRRLFISEHTVKVHKCRIIEKLEAANITHAVAIAFRRGILTPDV